MYRKTVYIFRGRFKKVTGGRQINIYSAFITYAITKMKHKQSYNPLSIFVFVLHMCEMFYVCKYALFEVLSENSIGIRPCTTHE